MKKFDHRRYVAFDSPYLSLTFDKRSARMAFLGIESGGRDRDKHTTYNLTLAGHGGMPTAFLKSAPVADATVITDDTVTFKNGVGDVSRITVEGDRSFRWYVSRAPKNQALNVRFSIKTAPPTVWCASNTGKNLPKPLPTKDPLVVTKHRYSLPMIIHFPDFGRIRIEANAPEVYCIEELRKSADFTGLNLGFQNYDGSHNVMNALQYGCASLTFRTKDEAPVELTFTVMEELYPALPFEGGESSDWNGLRRCWMNSFALNRRYFDMGDNIYLHGCAHLSVQMKSDLLQVMGGDDEHFRMVRRAFERQMKNSFLFAQAADGEVNFAYAHREKGEEPMCAFIDSTPGSVIATAGIAHWNLPLARELLPYAMKAANFILTLDKDGDGIFEVPFSGNEMEAPVPVGERQRNWWDNFAFGHKDIYFNCLCHRALRELSELLEQLGRADEAEKYRRQLAEFEKNFYSTYYNPATGVLAGWISADGRMHDYMFTFAVSMAIDEGLISKEQGKEMLLILLKKMEEQGYGDLRYGIPGNVLPVADPDTIHWPCMSDWGRYENGGLCGMNGFHFLTAMYKVGLTEEADAIFKAILHTYDTQFTHTGLMPGYVQSVDWRTKEGNRCGYNYLADNYYFLLAAYTGKAGIDHPAVVK